MKKVIIMMKLSLLIGVVASLVQLFNNRNVEAKLFTEEELKIFENFQDEVLTLGFIRGKETNYNEAIKQLFQEELSIEVNLISFECLEEVTLALNTGELDFFLNMISENYNIYQRANLNRDEFYYIRFPVIESVFAITSRDNPIGNLTNFDHANAGFLENSFLFYEYVYAINNIYFFDSVKATFEALSEQEIDVFLTRLNSPLKKMIARKDLQVEFAFRSGITQLEILTAQAQFYPILDVFEEIVNSPRKNVAREMFSRNKKQNLLEEMRNYTKSNFSSLGEKHEIINIAHYEKSFPYLFVTEDGISQGRYVEWLDLFQKLTDIPFYVNNNFENKDQPYLLNKLKENYYHFIVSTGDFSAPDLVVVGPGVDDHFISVIVYENRDLANTALYGLRFGIVPTVRASRYIMNYTDYKNFETPDKLINALIQNEIDVAILRKSRLRYFRYIKGYSTLMPINIINTPSNHYVLGNVENEDLNNLILYLRFWNQLLNSETINAEPFNNFYQSRYIQALNHQRNIYMGIAVGGIVIAILTILQMGNKNNKLKIENERDKFTGLYNRETAEKKCKRLIQENFDTYGVFLFIDIDDLKYCNDTYGHVAGDEMIREFSAKLKGIEGKRVICSRIAGDEFSIFKIGYNSVAEIHEDLVNFTENLAFDFKVNHKINIPITMSVGGSIYNLDTQDFQELVKFADFAMYQGKGEKKKKPKEKRDNVTIELFNKQMCKKYSNEITKTIIEKKQLYSVYQTINQLGGKEIYGYEGLTRPFNTNISNIIELIELADLHGELNNLDLLMMESIVRGFNGNGKLFINMEYKEPKFVEEYINKLIEIVMEVGISPENIVIEVSERKQWALESINLLKLFRKKYNFLIAIDDFGAGFANNYLLMELRPEIVKIDRSLITNVHKEKGKYEYLVTLSEFIKKQDIKIIYEGVELKEEIEVISEISLDYAQGWFFGKPVEMNSKIPDGNSSNQNNPKVTPPVPVI